MAEAAMHPAKHAEPHTLFDTLLVIDFGSQYTHLITRRLRELSIYSEMLPCTTRLADIKWKPKGIILSGKSPLCSNILPRPIYTYLH
jgi:hypothetical protein